MLTGSTQLGPAQDNPTPAQSCGFPSPETASWERTPTCCLCPLLSPAEGLISTWYPEVSTAALHQTPAGMVPLFKETSLHCSEENMSKEV